MVLVSIIVIFILVFSFIGGITQGIVKSFFSLVALITSIPVAGLYYTFFAGLLGLFHNRAWENLVGFFIVMALVNIVLSIIFYFPRKILEKVWHEAFGARVIAGFLNLLGAAVGLVVLTTLLTVFPIWEWLAFALNGSSIINWLMTHLTFVQGLFPETLRFVPKITV